MIDDDSAFVRQQGRRAVHRLRTWTRVPGRAIAGCGQTLGSSVATHDPDVRDLCGRWGCYRGVNSIAAYDYQTEGFGGT